MIGINSQIETGGSGGGSVGIGFAVPINTAKSEIAQLEKGGTVRGAYLGLTSLTIDGSLSALNLPVKSGALVQSVQKGTPAAKAGIRGGTVSGSTENGQVAVGGDIVVSIDGKAVNSSEDLASDVGAKKPGDTVTIGLLRANGNGGYEHKTVTRHARQPPQLGARTRTRPKAERGLRARSPRATATVGGMSRRRPRSRSAGSPTSHDAELAVELGAWAVGMIFYERQPPPLLARARRSGSPRRCAAGWSCAGCSSTRPLEEVVGAQRGARADACCSCTATRVRRSAPRPRDAPARA